MKILRCKDTESPVNVSVCVSRHEVYMRMWLPKDNDGNSNDS